MQKFLGKLNYLRRFISNLSGKISAFAPILRLKNEVEFTWGHISNAPLMTSKLLVFATGDESSYGRVPFWLYIAVEDIVIGAVLMQVMECKEHIITYLSRRLINAETRYSFIENLCLSLFYACSKLRNYLLASTCVVAC
jgi:hypothetical protein